MTEEQIETYRAALKQARAAFDRATARESALAIEKYQLVDEIGRLRRTITALAALCSESPFLDKLGITDSCMEVMEAEKDEVSTQDVVRDLENLGFDMSSQKNPAASVHAVLSRLADKKKITRVMAEDGTVAWQGPNYSPTAITDDDIPF
jgi:hypothetical protein